MPFFKGHNDDIPYKVRCTARTKICTTYDICTMYGVYAHNISMVTSRAAFRNSLGIDLSQTQSGPELKYI